jgi:methyl-CpG-binding domain protein 4
MFGLIQEELAGEPFQLLVAVIFLNRTRGSMAIPLFRTVIEKYPTAESMAEAEISDRREHGGSRNDRLSSMDPKTRSA